MDILVVSGFTQETRTKIKSSLTDDERAGNENDVFLAMKNSEGFSFEIAPDRGPLLLQFEVFGSKCGKPFHFLLVGEQVFDVFRRDPPLGTVCKERHRIAT